MNNGIRIRNIEPQEITIEGATTVAGITNVYVNGVDVTVGTKAYVIVPTKTSELTNDSGFITSYTETDPTVPAYVKAISLADINAWNDKQNELVSGVNIKTINNNSLLGSGDIQITATEYQAGTGIDITGDTISNTITSYQDLTDLPTIPTTTGELINTSGFINNTVNDLTNYIRADLLEDILPSVSDSGTELYLQDTAPYTLHLELNPSEIGQFTTTGKNLFDIDNTLNDTWINSSGNIISYNGCGIEKINCNAGDTFTLSATWSVNSATDNGGIIAFYDNTDTLLSRNPTAVNNNMVLTATAPTNTSYMYVGHFVALPEKIQLEIGSTATAYEPYTGGIPAPNPEYPQDIHTITGENSVTIGNKNLLNLENIEKGRLDNGNIGYESNTTALSVTQNSISFTTNANYRGVVSEFINIGTNTNLCFSSSTNLSSGIGVAVYCYDENQNYLGGATTNYPSDYIRTYVVLSNTKYIRLQFQLTNAGSIVIDNPMLEYGSTATSFIPNEERIYPIELGDIELTKISTQWGDYENFIFKNSLDSPWYDSNYAVNSFVLGSRVFKYTLSSDDNWQVGGGGSYYTEVNYNQLGSTKHFAISNYFQDQSLVNDPSTDSWIQTLGNMIILHFNSSLNINSVDDLKTWLDNNEVIVYAIRGGLADYNSYNQAIDYSLQNQWFNAANSIGYDGGTVITQENFDRPFDLSAKTIQKVTN